jgi:hypothetical protein
VLPRLRWLIGIHALRRRMGTAMLIALAATLAVLIVAVPPRPGSPVLLVIVLVAPLAGLMYALWNGGPLVAVTVTHGAFLLAPLNSDLGAAVANSYDVIALPSGLAAFTIAAWRAQRHFERPLPLGEGASGPFLLLAWILVVVAWALLLTYRPEELGRELVTYRTDALGQEVMIDQRPLWFGLARGVMTWAPLGLGLLYALARRGPALSFALATAPAWAWYIALVLGAEPFRGARVGEALLPLSVNDVRGTMMMAGGLLAAATAVALEPAWPWLRWLRAPLASRHQI